jgi:PAS domain-containing protein
MKLELDRRAYQELFERGPDGLLVSDPDGMIVRANGRAGELFTCSADWSVRDITRRPGLD